MKRTILLLLVLALLAGCVASPVGVQLRSMEEAQRETYANALSADKPTSFTVQVLLRLKLSEKFEDDPVGILAVLHKALGPSDDYEQLFALAELSLLHAKRTGSQPHFLAAAVYAYGFLFRDEGMAHIVLLDPRNRLAADFYNAALAHGLAIPPKKSDDQYNENIEYTEIREEEVALRAGRYPLPFGELVIDAPERFTWGGRVLQQFLPASQFRVYGIRDRYRQPGIGAPLIVGLGPTVPGDEAASRYIAPGSKLPMTAFLRLQDVRRNLVSGHLRGNLELYAYNSQRTVKVSGYDVPLEGEPTSAVAYAFKDFPVFQTEIYGFFGMQPQLFRSKGGHLATVDPYQPGKIPVVLVHGTASSPVRWAELFNEMFADPRIAQRYQFWIYTYNTGSAILLSGGILRQTLMDVVKEFDPKGTDPALRQMVVIGHSQGGLLAKLTAIDSGTKFWDNWFNKPFEEVEFKPETRELIRRSMFVTPLPFVKTVVFVCTPQRGSYVAAGRVELWLSQLVKRPGNLLMSAGEMIKAVAEGDPEKAKLLGKLPGSVNNMDPSSVFVKTISAIPVAPTVKAHSIIAVNGGRPHEEDDDGVVAYKSAHIEEAVSEKIIVSGHSVQGNPEAIEEVRRILLLHAAAQDKTQ